MRWRMGGGAVREGLAAAHCPSLFSRTNQFFMGVTAFAPRALAVFLVRDFYPDGGEARVGPATGALASAFNLAQLAVSYPWGWASDASGRPKWLILLANVVCGAGSAAFALAPGYGAAMAARVVAGLFMTSGVVMKALIGMTTSKIGQVRGRIEVWR